MSEKKETKETKDTKEIKETKDTKETKETKESKSKWKLYLGISFVLLFLVIGIVGSVKVVNIVEATPAWNPQSLKSDMTTIIFDKNGEVLAQLYGAENRIPVSIDEIPKHVQEAFIAIEDARFYQHNGVDLRAITRAAMVNLQNNKVVEGGSTITQQLAKNSFLSSQKTFERKIKEAVLAYELEKKYSKEEILEFYLNRVYFGHGCYGVQSAAKLYFNKNIEDVTLAEGALLAGIIKAPNSCSPFKNPDKAKLRMQTVLASMEKYNYISHEQRMKAGKEGYSLADLKNSKVWKHPFFIDYVIDYITENLKITEDQLFRGGLRVYTTLDPKIQTAAEAALSDEKNFPKSKPDQLIQSAMVVIDYRTGEIKALVGGRKHEIKRGFNRATQMRRQPGSSFKPLVSYGPALELKYPPTLVLNDAPTTFKGGYAPKNSNGRFLGPINMRTAIKFSVNVYSVKLLDLIGIDAGFNFAKKLGIQLTKTDKVLPLALGGLTYGVTPLEMARAYGAFANQGVLVESTPIIKITDGQNKTIVESVPKRTTVMKQQTAYLMTELLQGVVNGGTATTARMNRPVAGKTGTSQVPDTKEFRGLGRAHKDAWFVGYTPELVASVWMGYDNTDREHYLKVFGGNNPARIWKTVMSQVLKDVPVKQFSKPDIRFNYRRGKNAGVEIFTAEEKKKLEEEKRKKAEEERRKIDEQKRILEEQNRKIEDQKIENQKRKEEEQKQEVEEQPPPVKKVKEEKPEWFKKVPKGKSKRQEN